MFYILSATSIISVMTESIEFKITVVGDDAAGKSSVIRAILGEPFTEVREPMDESYVCLKSRFSKKVTTIDYKRGRIQ